MRKVVEVKANSYEEVIEGLNDIFNEISEDIKRAACKSEEEKDDEDVKISVEFEPAEEDEDDCEEECCNCCECDNEDADNEWFVIPGKFLHHLCDLSDIARFSEGNDEFIRNASELVGVMTTLHFHVVPEKRFYEVKKIMDSADECLDTICK